ncbi:MAG: lysine--tRNA ligase, partial [Clostridiales bacterium]|nr:lysine--tRNA ligase [Clostridiales bacterium]
AAPTSSYNTSRIIADKVFGCQAPDFIGYEFIGIKGSTGKMSGSTGLNLTPKTLLNIYQPEVILWLYAKNETNKAFNFCFDDEILRQYFEFDKMYNAVAEGTADERTRDIMYLSRVNDRKLDTVPMALLVALGSIVDFKPDMVETIFDKIGTPYSREQFAERLELAKFWTEQCSPESLNHLLEAPNRVYYEALDESEQADIDQLYHYLSQPEAPDLDALQTELYAIPKRNHPTDDQKELKKIQGKFFQNVYQLLIGKSRGPRLYLFLHAIERQDYLPLLNFKA